MYPGFKRAQVQTSGATINLVMGGNGPPVLLLHGYPQTHAMWHRVAPQLAERCTVVAADLRGYGDSSKPAGGPEHAAYAKRAMAHDMLEVMASLGFAQFAVVGHDRGGRVAHRLALDAPQAISRMAVLDIVPTYHVFTNVTAELARLYYHWFFLIQPDGLPERLIGNDPHYYLHKKLGGWGSASLHIFAPEALAEYERCFTPAMIQASCEDYRAAASIDLQHDAADRQRRLACPLLVLWGARGVPQRCHDVLATWRAYATQVAGRALECGHYLAEEQPAQTLAELLAFL